MVFIQRSEPKLLSKRFYLVRSQYFHSSTIVEIQNHCQLIYKLENPSFLKIFGDTLLLIEKVKNGAYIFLSSLYFFGGSFRRYNSCYFINTFMPFSSHPIHELKDRCIFTAHRDLSKLNGSRMLPLTGITVSFGKHECTNCLKHGIIGDIVSPILIFLSNLFRGFDVSFGEMKAILNLLLRENTFFDSILLNQFGITRRFSYRE